MDHSGPAAPVAMRRTDGLAIRQEIPEKQPEADLVLAYRARRTTSLQGSGVSSLRARIARHHHFAAAVEGEHVGHAAVLTARCDIGTSRV